jgi:Tol biopolymer transport system component
MSFRGNSGSRRTHRLAPAIVVLLLAALAPATAIAFYGHGAQIVSADFERLEQGDDSTVFAAISADGRYVAIQTRARNFFDDADPDPPGRYRAGGVFRFDLATRALEKVADGDLFEEGSNQFLRRGASNPSISADGRYVAFATAEQLLPADGNDHVDVYVRDMTIPVGAAGAFDLVSARDGGDVPAGYGPPPFPFPGSEPGADVSRGVSISADGQKVVFRTDAPSDLPAAAAPDTPSGQLFLRDRVANTTTLVTAQREGEAMTEQPAGGAVGGAVSADGTTVAWTGRNAGAQTPFLGGENADPTFLYYLWRRIADGPSAQTRRITGIADVDDPSCPPDSVTFFNQTSTGACFGPLTDQEGTRSGIASQLPALSGDGATVAFLTGAGPRPNASTGTGLDVYVTRMTPGLSRKASTIELTRDPPNFDPGTSSPISSLAISPDGRYLAFTTVRTTFVLPALQLLGEVRAIPGTRDVFVADLETRTLERVARSHQGGDIDGDVQNGVTVSSAGAKVAFTSFAGNLFFGDANQSADAFVAERQPDPSGGLPPRRTGAGGPAGTIEVDRGGPQIAVRARSMPGGAIVLTVSVPSAGGLKAVAKARAGTPRRPRTLAVATARAHGTTRSSVRMTLSPVDRYRDELRERETIRGRVAVTFVASRGARRAAASIGIVFRQEATPAKRPKQGRK